MYAITISKANRGNFHVSEIDADGEFHPLCGVTPIQRETAFIESGGSNIKTVQAVYSNDISPYGGGRCQQCWLRGMKLSVESGGWCQSSTEVFDGNTTYEVGCVLPENHEGDHKSSTVFAGKVWA